MNYRREEKNRVKSKKNRKRKVKKKKGNKNDINQDACCNDCDNRHVVGGWCQTANGAG
jgi:hypothetical protein